MSSDFDAVERLSHGRPVHEVLDTSSAEAWIGLDAAVRASARTVPEQLRVDGRRLRWDRGSRLPRVDWPAPPDEARLAIALCHPDGRIREAALKWTAGAPALRPLLLIRCTDWARPVRERARALLSQIPSRELITLAPHVLRLSRRAQGDFGRGLLDRALRECPAPDVETLLTSEDRATRRFAYGISVDRSLLSPAALARAAAGTDDPRVQTLCAEAAVAAMRTDACDEVLVPLLSSRSPQARSAGVTALRRAGRHRDAKPFLADRSAVVRACARYVLRQDGVDPLPLYRSMCADPADRPAAAAGLGECGSRADAQILWPLVAHPLPAVRLHTVAGLRALDAVTRERLSPLLDDPSSAVVRAATCALLPDADGFPEEWLRERTASDRPRAVRVAAQRLLRARLRAGGR